MSTDEKQRRDTRIPKFVLAKVVGPTPGPLEVGYYVPSDTFRAVVEHIAVVKPTGELVALTGSANNERTPESIADALLFAGAGQLFAALVAMGPCGQCEHAECLLARAALLKARPSYVFPVAAAEPQETLAEALHSSGTLPLAIGIRVQIRGGISDGVAVVVEHMFCGECCIPSYRVRREPGSFGFWSTDTGVWHARDTEVVRG